MLGYVYVMPQSNIFYLLLFGLLVHRSRSVDIQPGPHVIPNVDRKVLAVEKTEPKKKEDIPTLTIKVTNETKVQPKAASRGDMIFPKNDEKHDPTTIAGDGVIHENYQTPMIESGAIKRGILVFVGLSMLFIGYVGFKTYRNRGKTPNIVKYGIRARRTDMEMRPFSLEEDDEDETLFDLKHVHSTK